MSKYHNIKTIVDGIRFDSKKESQRYCELKLQEKNGDIQNLKLQPVFILQKSFDVTIYLTGKIKKVRAIKYIADFQYETGTLTIVEDVKGMKTSIYKLKRKLFLKKYPKLLFRET